VKKRLKEPEGREAEGKRRKEAADEGGKEIGK
jgi:hypothetical protein